MSSRCHRCLLVFNRMKIQHQILFALLFWHKVISLIFRDINRINRRRMIWMDLFMRFDLPWKMKHDINQNHYHYYYYYYFWSSTFLHISMINQNLLRIWSYVMSGADIRIENKVTLEVLICVEFTVFLQWLLFRFVLMFIPSLLSCGLFVTLFCVCV